MSAPTNTKILPYKVRVKQVEKNIRKQLNGLAGNTRQNLAYKLWSQHLMQEVLR